MADSDLRYPLQSGETAIDLLDIAKVIGFFLAIPVGQLIAEGNAEGADIFVVAVVLPLMAFSAFRRRATDLIISARGLRIVGGPRHDTTFEWAEIDPATTVSLTDTWRKVDDQPLTRLLLGLRTHPPIEVARSYDADEALSFQSLVKVIQDGAAQALDPAPVVVSAEVLRCAGCGALLVPVDAEVSPCASCGAPCTIPPALAERVRHAIERPGVERAVRAALRQPSAESMNKQLVALALAVVIGVPVVCGFVGYPYLNRMLLALAVIGLAAALVHRRMVGRHALRIVFGMAGTRGADGAPACRACGGPLPKADPGAPIVACAYCSADNVLGLVGGRRSSVDGSGAEVQRFLAARRRALVRPTMRLLAWSALTFGCIAWMGTGTDLGPVQVNGGPAHGGFMLAGGNRAPPYEPGRPAGLNPGTSRKPR